MQKLRLEVLLAGVDKLSGPLRRVLGGAGAAAQGVADLRKKLKALNAVLTVAQTERIQVETMWKSVQGRITDQVPMTQIAAVMAKAVLAEGQTRIRPSPTTHNGMTTSR